MPDPALDRFLRDWAREGPLAVRRLYENDGRAYNRLFPVLSDPNKFAAAIDEAGYGHWPDEHRPLFPFGIAPKPSFH